MNRFEYRAAEPLGFMRGRRINPEHPRRWRFRFLANAEIANMCCIALLMMITIIMPAPLFVPAAIAQESECTDGLVTGDALDRVTKCAIGRFLKCDIGHAVARGLFETGLRPVFPAAENCREIDEGYAIAVR